MNNKNSYYKKILLIPCNDLESLSMTVNLINKILRLINNSSAGYSIKLYVIGNSTIVKYIGKNVSRNALKKGYVILYKVSNDRDSDAEVLRLFININPDLILYILYKKDLYDGGFKAELFYGLRYSRKIDVASIIIRETDDYVDYGYKLRSVEEALKLIKGVVA